MDRSGSCWRSPRVPAWKGSCGCFGRVPDGKIYQKLSVVSDLLAKITNVVEVGRLPKGLGTMPALAGGMFARLKRGDCVGKTKCGKGTKVMTMVDRDEIPLSLAVYSASPAEVRLIEPRLTHRAGTTRETTGLRSRRGL